MQDTISVRADEAVRELELREKSKKPSSSKIKQTAEQTPTEQ